MEDNAQQQDHVVRNLYGADVEVRAIEVRAEENMTITGYASVYGDEYDLGYFTERVAPGAFEGRLDDDVRLLINHEGMPLARTTNGTLELTTDGRGLFYRAQLADTQEGRDLYKLIQRGDITQSSFAFTIDDDEWTADRKLRTIKRVGRLYDVSPVTYPASPTTTVQARAMAAGMLSDEAEQRAEQVQVTVQVTVTEMPEEPHMEETPMEEPAEMDSLNLNTFERIKPFADMKLNDLKALRASKIAQLKALAESADLMQRGLSDAEESTVDTINSEVAEPLQNYQRLLM